MSIFVFIVKVCVFWCAIKLSYIILIIYFAICVIYFLIVWSLNSIDMWPFHTVYFTVDILLGFPCFKKLISLLLFFPYVWWSFFILSWVIFFSFPFSLFVCVVVKCIEKVCFFLHFTDLTGKNWFFAANAFDTNYRDSISKLF